MTRSTRGLARPIALGGALLLSALLGGGGCAARPIVATFDALPTPVLLSKVDRVGGSIPQTPPPALTRFSSKVASSYVVAVDTTTETETVSTGGGGYKAGSGSGGSSGYKAGGSKGSGGSSGYKAGGSKASGSGSGYKAASATKPKAYKAPARTTPSTVTVTTTETDVFAAGGYDGANKLTYAALFAMASRPAREQAAKTGGALPDIRDVDIRLTRVRAWSYFFMTSEQDTDAEGKSKSSVTYAAENRVRIDGVVTPVAR
jgi:hypothetical protein